MLKLVFLLQRRTNVITFINHENAPGGHFCVPVLYASSFIDCSRESCHFVPEATLDNCWTNNLRNSWSKYWFASTSQQFSQLSRSVLLHGVLQSESESCTQKMMERMKEFSHEIFIKYVFNEFRPIQQFCSLFLLLAKICPIDELWKK